MSTAEQMEARDGYRQSLYRDLYGTHYNYAKATKSSASGSNYEFLDDPLNDLDYEDVVEELPAAKKPPKPYMPPTNFNPDLVNPFAGTKLDAPLN